MGKTSRFSIRIVATFRAGESAGMSHEAYGVSSWLGGSTRGLTQPGGHVHKEAAHLLSLQPAVITSSGAFKPESNGLSQFREDTGKPSVPVREFNLIACPLT